MDQRRRFSAFVAKGRDPRPAILKANDFTRDFATDAELEKQVRVKLAIIVEELVSNSLRHGGANRDIALWFTLEEFGGGVALEFEDDGDSFDPADAPSFKNPNPNTGGGIGLAIVRAWGEDIAYARLGDHNVLALKVS